MQEDLHQEPGKDARLMGFALPFYRFFGLVCFFSLCVEIYSQEVLSLQQLVLEMPKLGASPPPFLPVLLSAGVILVTSSRAIFSQNLCLSRCTGEMGAPGLSRVLKKSKMPVVLLCYLLQKMEVGSWKRGGLHEEKKIILQSASSCYRFCIMLITSSNPDFSLVMSLVTGYSFSNWNPWDMACTSPVCSQLPLKSKL